MASDDTSNKFDNNKDEFKSPTKTNKPAKEMFDRPDISTPTLKENKEYLQSFDRRHSDSNYMINHNSSLEKMNLAEEIKKLSDRLLMLSCINNDLIDYNDRMSEKTVTTTAADNINSVNENPKPPLEKIEKSELLKNMKNAVLNENFSKSIKISESTKASVFMRSKNVHSNSSDVSPIQTPSKSVVSDLTKRLKSLDETPSLFKEMLNVSNVLEKQPINNVSVATSTGKNSQQASPFNNQHKSAPWSVTNRRTKFRITQLSRDVPIGSPDSHQTIFLEEAANTTKDCLLHLLEKYNGNESRSSNGIRRHQSISVGFGIADNLEYHSMNSINAFFKRNAFQQNGTEVKRIQARIESKK